MSKLVAALNAETSKTRTENGMRTFSTSKNACLDFFFMGGASRNKNEQEIISMFSKAYHEDKELAIMILGYIRDIREGMGERRLFRICLKHMIDSNYPINLSYIPELGRWDDLFHIKDENVLKAIKQGLKEKNGLLAKWLPRKAQYNNISKRIREYMNLTPKEYRKLIVHLSQTVETQMCNNEWKGINYSHVPSIANKKYNAAFFKHDPIGREAFINKAKKGEVKINAGAIFPYDIVKMMISSTGNVKEGDNLKPTKNDAAIAMWNQLPNHLKDCKESILPICDTSGSMNGLPLLISISLGIYISERNEGLFKDAFITFSRTPELQYTKGDLYERICQMKAFHPSNTNLEATFELILSTATKAKIKQAEMPSMLLIISDMEFDQATRPNHNALKMIKDKYKSAGYEMPSIIFWNVNSRSTNIPVRFTKEGVGLISGASPAVIKAVMGGKIHPMTILLQAVDKERYHKLIV